jgi:hypothetical protein
MTRDFGAQPALRPIHQLGVAFCILVGLAFALCAPSSSVVHADLHVYDEPVLARSDTRAIERAEARPMSLSDVRERSVSPSAGPSGASTTSVARSNATNSARVWSSADNHVGSAANAIEAAFPGRIAGVNQNIAMTTRSGFREVDIVLDNVLVQVKGGNATGLTGQVLQTSQTTGQTVIGFAPGIPEAAWAAAARQGVPIARTHDELIRLIAELG